MHADRVMIEAMEDGGYIVYTPVDSVNWKRVFAATSEEDMVWQVIAYLTGCGKHFVTVDMGEAIESSSGEAESHTR